MNQTQQLTSSAIEPTFPGPRVLPVYLRGIAFANLVIGPLLAIVNVVVISNSMAKLSAAGLSSSGLLINIALFLVLGALLVVGGIGLLRRQRWGHRVSFAAGIFCFVVHFGVFIVTFVLKAMYESGALQSPGQFRQVKIVGGIPGLSTLYGIVLIVILLLPYSRAWARGETAAPSLQPGQAANAATPRPTSGLAIASLVCSMIPFAMLTQIAGLTLGIIALVKIKKSKGALGGRGFAIAGVIISSLLILFIASVIVLIAVTGGFK